MTVNPVTIGLLGAGGHAAEVADYVRRDGLKVAFQAVSATYLDPADPGLIDVAKPTAAQAATPVVAAVGAPLLRRTLVETWPGDRYATVCSDLSYCSEDAGVSAGAVVAPHAAVGARSTIGQHAVVNLGATVSHDCHVGDYATLSPGVHVGGGCRIGKGAFLGIGAIVRDHVDVAAGTVVGAGAMILKDTVENGIYMGVPARLIAVREGWLAVV